MKIITWSCNLRLKDKFEFLEAHNPDIAIVQECESLPKSFFPGARYQWAGKDQKKGLSVVDFTESSEVDQASMRILPSFCRSTSMAEGKNCWQPGRLGYVSRWLSQSNKINKDVCGQ